jgi:hypothetical protein
MGCQLLINRCKPVSERNRSMYSSEMTKHSAARVQRGARKAENSWGERAAGGVRSGRRARRAACAAGGVRGASGGRGGR